MKTKRMMTLALLGLLLFNSCSKDNEGPEDPIDEEDDIEVPSAEEITAGLIKADFMSGISVGEGIEKGEYTSGNATPILNQWNKGHDDEGGANPVAVEALTYDGYIESGTSPAFRLERLTNAESRQTSYTLTEEPIYSEETYYLSFMINVLEGGTSGVIMFDGNATTNYRRVVLGINATGTGDQFKFFFAPRDNHNHFNEGVTESSLRDYNTTYLMVLKVNPSTGTADLFVNPPVGTYEPENSTASITTTDLAENGIRAITVRQRTNYSAIVGGLRFANSWVSATARQ